LTERRETIKEKFFGRYKHGRIIQNLNNSALNAQISRLISAACRVTRTLSHNTHQHIWNDAYKTDENNHNTDGENYAT